MTCTIKVVSFRESRSYTPRLIFYLFVSPTVQDYLEGISEVSIYTHIVVYISIFLQCL